MAEKKSEKKVATTKKATSLKITKSNGKIIKKSLKNKQQYLDKGYKVEEI